MRTGHTPFLGDIASAVAGLITASRDATSRHEALARLRASVQRRGGLSAFAGTPCSNEGDVARSGASSAQSRRDADKGDERDA